MSPKPVVVIAGLGSGGGTGGASARAFAKEGYSVALIARNADSLKAFESELKGSGIDVASFPIASYAASEISSAFEKIRKHYPKPSHVLRAAVFNAGHGVWKPFLQITLEDIKATYEANIEGAYAFSREVLLEFTENPIEPSNGAKGVLIFTGATASIRGNVTTSAFAAGKHALRGLSQALAKEFGKQNIHVAHAIIDGVIFTPRTKERLNNPEWESNEDIRLNADSIAASYVYLAKQDRSSWTWELDLRPAHEKW
ncbi:short-chain dehydrogenase/reductase SDR [Marasmius fiardii PR-910]|nr:short-chain dehydrogenase/reductase SDR [Marasmius fiardii PR-910]